jgi:hypothetical protein
MLFNEANKQPQEAVVKEFVDAILDLAGVRRSWKPKTMQALFNVQKQVEQGTTNPMSAHLTVQVINLLQACGADQNVTKEIVGLYTLSLLRRLLRCAEIEARIRGHIETGKAEFKPATGAAQQLPHVPNLKEDCENFLHEFRGFLVDLIRVFNHLYGTDYSEASEWTTKTRSHPKPVVDHADETFGKDNLKTRFLAQMKTSHEPFVWMRHAVTHPGERSGTLTIQDFSLDAQGNLIEPMWWREKGGARQYGPELIRTELAVGVHNLFVSGEDTLAMWAMDNLKPPGVTTLGVIPETARDPGCPLKYKVVLGSPGALVSLPGDPPSMSRRK